MPSFGGYTDAVDVVLHAPAGLLAITDDATSGIAGKAADELGKKWEFDGKLSKVEQLATAAYILGASLDIPETVQVIKDIKNTPSEEYQLHALQDWVDFLTKKTQGGGYNKRYYGK